MDTLTRFNLAVIVGLFVAAFAVPGWGARGFERAERAFERVARRRGLSVLLVIALSFFGRLALMAWLPPPLPIIHDEFSHLLAADTFAAGRLTNPTHPMWPHFETMHVIQQPTYTTMYPPLQGLFLAAGQVLTGRAYVGVWLSGALMCGALTWMLQGWLPPKWALLGGLLAVMRLGLVGYWMNSYWGGAPAALGGALLLGALPRIQRQPRVGDALLLVLGLAVLANSRPYEGFVLGALVALALLAWLVRQRGPRLTAALLRFVLPAALGVLLAAGATCFYFWSVTGDPLRMPYQVDRETYASAGYFLWQEPRPEPAYHDAAMREFYQVWEMEGFNAARGEWSPLGFVIRNVRLAGRVCAAMLGPLLAWPLLMLPWVALQRRLRFLLLAAAVMLMALSIEVFFNYHYAAPIVSLLFALSLAGMRIAYCSRLDRRHVGRFLVRATPVVYLVLLIVGIAATRDLRAMIPAWPWEHRSNVTMDSGRQRALQALEANPGGQLVLVRYLPDHPVHAEWVYNRADIDGAKVVWARELGPEQNAELLRYFHDRTVWLLEVGATSASLAPYPAKR